MCVCHTGWHLIPEAHVTFRHVSDHKTSQLCDPKIQPRGRYRPICLQHLHFYVIAVFTRLFFWTKDHLKWLKSLFSEKNTLHLFPCFHFFRTLTQSKDDPLIAVFSSFLLGFLQTKSYFYCYNNQDIKPSL